MGRGNRPEISQYQRLRWLEGLESGKGITQISKEAGHDIRIVKRHIEIAREERQAALATHDFLLKRLEEHQEDLLAQVRRLRKLFTQNPPGSLTPDDAIEKKKFNALKEHFEHLAVKKQLDECERVLARYSAFKKDASSELNAEESKLISAIPKEVVCYPWTPVILEVLESGLSFEQSGRKYEKEPADGKWKPSWGDRILTRSLVTKEQYDLVEEAHKKLVSFAKKYLPEFQEYKRQFEELSDRLTDQLDVFIIKRVVAGRCRYCPA
jgi:hypothetical protein